MPEDRSDTPTELRQRSPGRPHILRVIAAHPDLNTAAVAVLMVLAEHAWGAKDRCWPSVPTIARIVRKSESTVQRALRTLRAAGLVGTEPADNHTGRVLILTWKRDTGDVTQETPGVTHDTVGVKTPSGGRHPRRRGSVAHDTGVVSPAILKSSTQPLNEQPNQQHPNPNVVVAPKFLTAEERERKLEEANQRWLHAERDRWEDVMRRTEAAGGPWPIPPDDTEFDDDNPF